MTEKALKNAVIDRLKLYITNYAIEDFPYADKDYIPTHVNGSILVKKLSMVNTYSNLMMIERGQYDPFGTRANSIGLWIVARNMRTQDEILDLTEDIKSHLCDFYPDKEFRMYFLNADEPYFDHGRNLMYRNIIYTVPGIEFVGN